MLRQVLPATVNAVLCTAASSRFLALCESAPRIGWAAIIRNLRMPLANAPLLRYSPETSSKLLGSSFGKTFGGFAGALGGGAAFGTAGATTAFGGVSATAALAAAGTFSAGTEDTITGVAATGAAAAAPSALAAFRNRDSKFSGKAVSGCNLRARSINTSSDSILFGSVTH